MILTLRPTSSNSVEGTGIDVETGNPTLHTTDVITHKCQALQTHLTFLINGNLVPVEVFLYNH